jgi:hypothetical protein
VGVVFASYGVIGLLARRLGRRHVAGALLAGLTAAVLGASLTFPVWTRAGATPLSEAYFNRQPQEMAKLTSEPWHSDAGPDASASS